MQKDVKTDKKKIVTHFRGICNWRYDCHRSRGFDFYQRFIFATWSIDRRSIGMHDAILGQNVPIRAARLDRQCNEIRFLKSLPRIIPRKKRFALLIEIEIINKPARARSLYRGERWKGPIISESRKTMMVCSYKCLVIEIAEERSRKIILDLSSRDQI